VVGLEPLKREPFDLCLSLIPIWDLKTALIDGSAICRHGAPAEAEAADLEEIDVASFAYAAAVLEEEGGPFDRLHMPVSFITLATQRARERLFRLTDSVRETMRLAAVIEICDLDAVPASRLLEVAGLIRGLCLGVVGRVRPSRAALAAVRGCGLTGVSVEAARLGLENAEPAVRLNAFAAAARDIGPDLFVHDLPSASLVDAAGVAGFSHASVAPAPRET
jgi:hypothetical protein